MKREDAIMWLNAERKARCRFGVLGENSLLVEAIDMAIEALNNTTDKQNDTVELTNDAVDLISRADAIELLTKIVFDEPPYLDSETLCRLYAEEQINALPSADAVSREQCDKCQETTERVLNNQGNKIKELEADRPQGEWIIEERESIYGTKYMLTCSVCGDSVSVTEGALPHEKYCRNCGADMRKNK